MNPATIDERDILPEIVGNRSGMLLGDKGLIRPSLEEMLARQGLDLQTPLRKNMNDKRPKKLVSIMMNMRRIVETMIGQLVDRFYIQSIKLKIYGIYQQKLEEKYWLTLFVLCSIWS